jgi:GNAT superfamily N-acetyltransferase
MQIRAMQLDDVGNVSSLMPDLGYEASPAELRARLVLLREWPDQEAFVVEANKAIIGLSQVQGVRLLASAGYAEIQALVIAADHQGKGYGSALLKHTVQWCFARGYPRVRLRSGLHRNQAHEFYVAQGFSQAKASYAFELRAP